MDDKVIVSNEFRSGWLLRVRKIGGKVNGVWLELSDHNAQLDASLASLNTVITQLKLNAEVGMNPPNPPVPPNPPSLPKPAEQPENRNVRYFCAKCSYNFPAFPSSARNMSYYCPSCNRWGNFEKR